MGGPPLQSLVKYDTPSLLTTKEKKGLKGATIPLVIAGIVLGLVCCVAVNHYTTLFAAELQHISQSNAALACAAMRCRSTFTWLFASGRRGPRDTGRRRHHWPERQCRGRRPWLVRRGAEEEC